TALVEHVDGRLEIIRWVTIDHAPHDHAPHNALPHGPAPGGDGAVERSPEAVEVQPRPAV
ncbi:MAG: hypothetical protein D6685_03785, partial [Bacteroidetes bacterium]